MADRGVKIFGVETISPDLVYLTDRYPTHRACAERGLTHYENLNNLVEVVGRRFEFYGFPLKLETAYGSPVRGRHRRRLTLPRRQANSRSRRPRARSRGTPPELGLRPAALGSSRRSSVNRVEEPGNGYGSSAPATGRAA